MRWVLNGIGCMPSSITLTLLDMSKTVIGREPVHMIRDPKRATDKSNHFHKHDTQSVSYSICTAKSDKSTNYY